MRYCANSVQFLGSLDSFQCSSEDVEEEFERDARDNLEAVVDSIVGNYEDASDYFRLLGKID